MHRKQIIASILAAGEAGFGSPDGLHYDQQTYELIANLIYNNVMLYQSLGY